MPVAADDLQLAANACVGVLTFVRKLGRGKLAPRGHACMPKQKRQHDEAGRQGNRYAQHERLESCQDSTP
jgi:hypothetical protein